MEKNTGKVREKSGNFVSPGKWEPWSTQGIYRYRIPDSVNGDLEKQGVEVAKIKTKIAKNSENPQFHSYIIYLQQKSIIMCHNKVVF